MTRTILAAAALAAATTLMASGAQACISCEYVPEVVRAHSTLPHTGHYYAAEPYENKGRGVAVSVKKRVAKTESFDKPVKAAKVEKADKPAKVAKVDKSDAEAPKVAKADPVANKADSENSSITVAEADPVKAEKPEAKTETAAKLTDCKKFFASVGMTLTVPCE